MVVCIHEGTATCQNIEYNPGGLLCIDEFEGLSVSNNHKAVYETVRQFWTSNILDINFIFHCGCDLGWNQLKQNSCKNAT